MTAWSETRVARFLEAVSAILEYDPVTGVFTNRIARPPRAKKGERAGWLSADGYVRIRIDGQAFLAHRLAWLLMTGHWPAEEIDHIDGVRSNNVWSNLRDCSRAQNQGNRHRPNRNNRLGIIGVRQVGRRFAATIRRLADGRRVHLGYFDTATEAGAAYQAAARLRMWDAFAREERAA